MWKFQKKKSNSALVVTARAGNEVLGVCILWAYIQAAIQIFWVVCYF